MDRPSQTLEHVLSETVPVPCHGCPVVGGTVTFDPEQVASWSLRVSDRQVYPIPGHADLSIHIETVLPERLPHRELEGRFGFAGRSCGFGRQPPLLCKRKIPLQHLRPALLDAGFVNVVRLNRRHKSQLPARASEGNVEPSLAAFQIHWTKAERKSARA